MEGTTKALCLGNETRKDRFVSTYDNGEYEWIDFHERKFRLLESDVEPESESSASGIRLLESGVEPER